MEYLYVLDCSAPSIYEIPMEENEEVEDEPENYKQQVKSEMTDLVKDYIRQKPAWSEEDEYHWMMCLECVEECATQEREDFSKTIDWLKSIKKMKENENRKTYKNKD